MPARFNDYTGINARFDSMSTSCGTNTPGGGHAIKKGDYIGWARGNRRRGRKSETQCADCWARWVDENRDAQAYEDRYSGTEFYPQMG